MRESRWCRRAVLAAVLLGIALTASAHREPGSLTSIKWNVATGNTEIIHRLHSHDAELGIGAALNISDLSVLDLEGRANIALYVERRFQIAGDTGPIKLKLIGAELAGDHILVYQEYTGRLPARITIRDDILRDAYPQQLNQVNIEDGDATHSLIFVDEGSWQAYSFQITIPGKHR